MPGIKPTMTDEEKTEYKKSVAMMMFFWIINTRHNWRQTVLDNQPNEWAKLSLTKEFKDLSGKLNEEWMNFFSQARSVVNLTQVRESIGAINGLAEGFWVSLLDPECPADEVINTMYDAAAKYVDAIPSSTTPESFDVEIGVQRLRRRSLVSYLKVGLIAIIGLLLPERLRRGA